MEVLDAIQKALSTCAKVIKWGAGIQEPARQSLVSELQGICTRCDEAYEAVLVRLAPIKKSFSNPDDLANEIRALVVDTDLRAKFKPEHLCGEIDHLLVRLASNLDPLKYSVDFRRIDDLRRYLQNFGGFDGAIFQSYDNLVAQLDRLASEMQNPGEDRQERARYAQHVIETFQDELRATQASVREAKGLAIGAI